MTSNKQTTKCKSFIHLHFSYTHLLVVSLLPLQFLHFLRAELVFFFLAACTVTLLDRGEVTPTQCDDFIHDLQTPNIGGQKPPKWMVDFMENPMKMEDLGGFPYIFGETPI